MGPPPMYTNVIGGGTGSGEVPQFEGHCISNETVSIVLCAWGPTDFCCL